MFKKISNIFKKKIAQPKRKTDGWIEPIYKNKEWLGVPIDGSYCIFYVDKKFHVIGRFVYRPQYDELGFFDYGENYYELFEIKKWRYYKGH